MSPAWDENPSENKSRGSKGSSPEAKAAPVDKWKQGMSHSQSWQLSFRVWVTVIVTTDTDDNASAE